MYGVEKEGEAEDDSRREESLESINNAIHITSNENES